MSFARIARSEVKPTMVFVLVLTIVASVAASSYVIPWSRLIVIAQNSDQTSATEMDVYVDGTLADSGVASAGEQFIVECRVIAGEHTVWLDYAVSEYQE
jgi:hypothetical protein